MSKSICESCIYFEEDKPLSWINKKSNYIYKNTRYYCTMTPHWLDYYKRNSCEFYEPRRKEEGTCEILYKVSKRW